MTSHHLQISSVCKSLVYSSSCVCLWLKFKSMFSMCSSPAIRCSSPARTCSSPAPKVFISNRNAFIASDKCNRLECDIVFGGDYISKTVSSLAMNTFIYSVISCLEVK